MSAARPLLFVLVPYAQEAGALVSPYYDTPEFRADVAGWIAPAEADWEWVVVTGARVADEVLRIARAGRERPVAVVNLCDGDDMNGYPGLSVVSALEAAGIAFTGADSAFYMVSTSKLAMKRRFAAAGVATAPWVEIADPDPDLRRAGAVLGFPMFLKPDVSFGSAGITLRSVIHDHAAGLRQVAALLAGMHGCRFARGGIYAEPFLAGQEYTALVSGDAGAPGGIRVLRPCERVFHPALPPEERYLTFERYCEEYDQDPPPPPDGPYYRYAPVDGARAAAIVSLSERAYRVLGGCGYARVDLRTSAADGSLYVLEVNANCALSSDDTSTAGAILAVSGSTMVEFIGEALRDAWRRSLRSVRKALY